MHIVTHVLATSFGSWVCTWICERENKVLKHILTTLYRVPNWDLVLFFFAFSFGSLFRGHQIILTFLIDRTALFWGQMDGDLVHVYIPKPNGSKHGWLL